MRKLTASPGPVRRITIRITAPSGMRAPAAARGQPMFRVSFTAMVATRAP
jgi:hypothetical protein